MISRSENQKILVQTRNENIEIESIAFLFEFSIECLVRMQEASKKDDFFGGLCSFSHFEIIKTN
jgi:hypothetical protein